jgi:hypothetical protein
VTLQFPVRAFSFLEKFMEIIADHRSRNAWHVTGLTNQRAAIAAVAERLAQPKNRFTATRTQLGYRVRFDATPRTRAKPKISREWEIRATEADLTLASITAPLSPARAEHLRNARTLLLAVRSARTNAEAADAMRRASVQVLYALRLREPRS